MNKNPFFASADSEAGPAKSNADPAEWRLLFITRKWPPAMGGMETWSVKVSEQLGQLCPTDVIALPGKKDGMPPSKLALLGFPFSVARRYFALQKRPTAVLLGDLAIWPLGLLLMLLGFRGKILIAAHGTDASFHRRRGLLARLYGFYLRLGSRFSDKICVFANSRATASVLKETHWNAIATIPLATDLDVKASGDQPAGDALEILFAGRLVKRKGCGWFAGNVLPLLPDNTILKIAGTGWSESEEWVLNQPQVRHLGVLNKDELGAAFASADCVVVPNIEPGNGEYEGFGLVAVEAAAAGGVVLAADHGGLKDAVIDGETGILLPVADASAWSRKIREVSQWSKKERAQFTARSVGKVREHYNWQRVAKQIIELCEDR